MIDGRKHYVVLLKAKITGLTYSRRRAWVDAEYFLPTKEELYAKSGKLLKSTTMDGVKIIQGRRYYYKLWFMSDFKKS